MTYYELVRLLPRPTIAQRDAFAHDMAQRHSWYKHLPVRPLAPFRFIIAPAAPQTSVPGARLLDRRYAFVDTAAGHLERYGHWCCEAPYAGGAGLVAHYREKVERAEHREITGMRGEAIVIPQPVLDAGVAWVNAFIDPRAARYQATWSGIGSDMYGADDLLAELAHRPSSREERRELITRLLTAEYVTAERNRMLGEMRAAMDRVDALIWTSPR